MLQPARQKFRKQQKGRMRGKAFRGSSLAYGEYGLIPLEPGYVTSRQIEAGRIAAQQYVRGEGRLYVRVFPHKSITARPLETRMGKGKGEPAAWVAVVREGTVLYELGGVTEEQAKICFARLAHKMPVKVRFVRRRPA